MKTLYLVLLGSLAFYHAASAQRLSPRMSKQEMLDSLKAHHVEYSEMPTTPGSELVSTLAMQRISYDGHIGQMYIDLTKSDSSAMVTFVQNNVSQEAFEAYRSAQESLYGTGNNSQVEGAVSVSWTRGDEMIALNYLPRRKEMALIRTSSALMPKVQSFDEASTLDAYKAGKFEVAFSLAEPA